MDRAVLRGRSDASDGGGVRISIFAPIALIGLDQSAGRARGQFRLPRDRLWSLSHHLPDDTSETRAGPRDLQAEQGIADARGSCDAVGPLVGRPWVDF